MFNFRRWYITVVIMSLVLMLLSGNMMLLAITCFLAIIPLILRSMLKQDVGNISLEISCSRSGTVRQQVSIFVDIPKKKYMTVASVLTAQIRYDNVMFGASKVQDVTLTLSGKHLKFDIPFIPEICGMDHVSLINAKCVDMFGLCYYDIESPQKKDIYIYPDDVPLHVYIDNVGRDDGPDTDKYSPGHPGSDISEIFELHEYIPGDEVRAIHWKLSEKLDKTIVKTGSRQIHTDTMIMLDIGRELLGEENGARLVAAAMGMSDSLSKRLYEMGVEHYISVSSVERLVNAYVQDEMSHIGAVETLLSLPLQEKTGLGVSRLVEDDAFKSVAKLICVAASRQASIDAVIWSKVAIEAQNMEITIICIVDELEKLRTDKKGNINIIEIPLRDISNNHNIVI